MLNVRAVHGACSHVPLVFRNALRIMDWPIYQMWALSFLFMSSGPLCSIPCCAPCTPLAMLACLYLQFSYWSSFVARALCLSQSTHSGELPPCPRWCPCTPLEFMWTLVSLICGNVHRYSYNTFYRCFRNFESHPFEHAECHMFVSVHVKVFLAHHMNGFLRKWT